MGYCRHCDVSPKFPFKTERCIPRARVLQWDSSQLSVSLESPWLKGLFHPWAHPPPRVALIQWLTEMGLTGLVLSPQCWTVLKGHQRSTSCRVGRAFCWDYIIAHLLSVLNPSLFPSFPHWWSQGYLIKFLPY